MIDRVKNLRDQYPQFEYKSYSWEKLADRLEISWEMSAGSIKYHPTLTLNLASSHFMNSVDTSSFEHLVFLLGMAEIPSYWKATCSPEIIVSAGALTANELKWWHKLYLQGMGQYFFENQIDFTTPDFLRLRSSTVADQIKPISANHSLRPLVLVSGGKDSSVTLALLRNHSLQLDTLSLNPTPATFDINHQLGLSPPFTASRVIDPTLLALNKDNYLNGHIPFSAYLAFLGILVVYLMGNNAVIASNEASSEEENVVYLGQKINHQYSKTLAFERDFQSYCQLLGHNFNYFSFLRPLYDLQIMGIFTRYQELLPLFRSCNVGQKQNLWCGHCPKCLSSYILLKPFVTQSTLLQIFGHDLLHDSQLSTLLLALRGQSQVKPFECVGTTTEINAVMDKLDLSVLLTFFGPDSMPDTYRSILRAALPVTVQSNL